MFSTGSSTAVLYMFNIRLHQIAISNEIFGMEIYSILYKQFVLTESNYIKRFCNRYR